MSSEDSEKLGEAGINIDEDGISDVGYLVERLESVQFELEKTRMEAVRREATENFLRNIRLTGGPQQEKLVRYALETDEAFPCVNLRVIGRASSEWCEQNNQTPIPPAQMQEARRPRIMRPGGHLLVTLCKPLLKKAGYERLVDLHIRDMRLEQNEALQAGQLLLARWVVLRCYLVVAYTLLSAALRALRRLLKG